MIRDCSEVLTQPGRCGCRAAHAGMAHDMSSCCPGKQLWTIQPLEPSFLHNAYGHHHYDEGPDLATGALSFLTPVLARQMGDIGSGKSERAQTTILPTSADPPGEPSNLLAIMACYRLEILLTFNTIGHD